MIDKSLLAEAVKSLSPRQTEVFILIAIGKTNAQIGKLLELSPKTVRIHNSEIYRKLGQVIDKRNVVAEIYREAKEAGWLE